MKTSNTVSKYAVGVALVAAFLLCWVNGAVGIIGADGDRFNLMYSGVLVVGLIGALIARFQPHGMSRALFAMAVAQMLVAVIALIAGKHHSPVSSVSEIMLLNGFFVALFLGSAWLFRTAAQQRTPAGAGPGFRG